MRYWLLWLLAASSTLMAAFAGESASTHAPASVDLTGVYMGMEPSEAPPAYRNTPYPFPPPFTAAGRLWSAYWADPRHNLGARCIPWTGAQGVMNAGTFFPVEIIQKDQQVTLINEYLSQVRRVYTDGRGHPQGLDKTWFGHSIGRWEGSTLVIDTIGGHAGPINGSGATVQLGRQAPEPRLPYSEALHLTERLRLLDGGKYLEDALTFDDPVIYTHSFTVRRYWRRAPELDMLEYVCTENMRPADEGMPALFGAGQPNAGDTASP